ncbi:HAD-like domain-containing protein [Pelagophyceae sp. CCMP2097]|nr:HAD-like domain-containing protein [Pelagophyceae sp. CCMP2097]
MTTPRAGIAFDIDGVFKYGRQWSPDGLSALQRVERAGLPYCFVTNGGGGLTEATYADQFGKKVAAAGGGSLEVDAADVILSYSPWRATLAPTYANQRVLVVGDPHGDVVQLAADFGLTKAVHYMDYVAMHPTLDPFGQAEAQHRSHTAVANGPDEPANANGADEEPFAAVLVFCDPYHWFAALQLCVDVLCSPNPLAREFDANAGPMPVHFSNPDVLWKAQHAYARFGQGAFKIALRALYKARLQALRVPSETVDERVGASLRQWGKPTEATFAFIEDRLNMAEGPLQRYYMVGDNPASDMEGVRRANIAHRARGTAPWCGVLVRSGVFSDGDETNGAETVVHGVGEAVDWIIKNEQEQR